VIGPLGFIGNIGWFEVNDVGEREGLRTWAEGHRRTTERCLKWLRYHYGKVAPEADAVVCLLHHVPFLELTTRVDLHHFDLEMETVGSERFGELLLDLEKVRYVICGHLHARKVFRAGDLKSFVVGGPNYDSAALLELETRTGHYQYTPFSAADRPQRFTRGC
jgi:Icc-related predicted phosphoesterase